MRVLISCYPTVGGSGVIATELAMALAESGDEVHVVSYAQPSRLQLAHPRLFFHQVEVSNYPLFEYPPYSLALATAMVGVVESHDIDLVHVHYAVPNAVSAVLARQILEPRPLKVVTTLHGTDITLVGNDPSYLATTRFSINHSDAVTAVSQALADQTHSELGVERDIQVVPNFIDPARYEGLGSDGACSWRRDSEKVLIHVSNFRPVKRIWDVIRIFQRIQDEIPSRLLLVGDGPERARAERECSELNICDRVEFLGNVGAIEQLVSGADLLLLPSETESFGLAALEAMAAGVPVVATEVGGLPEVVEDGVSGYLRPMGDVEALAEAAVLLLSNDERHRQFGQAARRRALDVFPQDRVVGLYREVYRSVL